MGQFSLLNDEQMSNRVGVKHLPANHFCQRVTGSSKRKFIISKSWQQLPLVFNRDDSITGIKQCKLVGDGPFFSLIVHCLGWEKMDPCFKKIPGKMIG